MASPAVLRERSRTLPKLLSHLTLVRFMGGGPRTFPGGLNKWQYKRMHEKMAREKERRLLQQEKQLYQARLRTEIRAKSAGRSSGDSADPASDSGGAMTSKEHIKALADRFMKAGAEDLWNDDDGPVRSAPRRSHASGSVPPLDLRKLVAERRNVVESTAGRTSSSVGSFSKREYSTMPGRRNGMRSKMRWRNSSSDEDSESDARVPSNGNSMKELRDADRGTPKNSRLFPKFSIESDGESEEDSGLTSRATAGKKIFSKAALRNYDMKTQRRVPGSIEGCSDLSNDMQEIRDELREKQAYAYDTTRRDAEEDSLLTKKRFDECGVSPLTIKALTDAGYIQMTVVQEATLPVCLDGKDALVKAKTGTGKSAAFLLPAIETVIKATQSSVNQRLPQIHVLIICPTRELAIQVAAEANVLLKHHAGIGVQTLTGGTRFKMDQKRLESNPCQVGIPPDREQYIHRLGRTGRQGKDGKGILLLAPWEEYFMEQIKDLPIKKYQLLDLDSDTKQKVEDSIGRVDPSIKEAAYHAWLGYYNSIREVGRDKTMLADLANQFCHSIGLEKPPALFRRTALKMGLKGIPGIRVNYRVV
ncbi:DEAD-box ATP-dependent RNA helicase [Musa troglodytarum]|uniref:ATP-dependent RNA helicase n=1 Tax=Musa troglodytarum TaxID=320322 RepID=A0A9E7JU24_9LILI|nr:DEAD-box ATP-dependent RNA helicase [Musa troglodytarum]